MHPEFDPHQPPTEPPYGVRQPLLWRLAWQVHRDHRRDESAAAAPGPPLCRVCGRSWPCNPRRLAEYALVAAFRPVTGTVTVTDRGRAG